MTDTGPLFASSGNLIADRRYRWALDLAARGDLAGAADILAQTVALAPAFAAAWTALGALRGQLGDLSGATAAFEAARACDPDDYHGARLQLAFDQYATRYNAALTEQLAYRGPEFLRGAVDAVMAAAGRPTRFASVLDLGCGTGLCAAAFRQHADRLIGIDLSPTMIAQAAAKGIYDSLLAGEIEAFLMDEAARAVRYHLVLAADVFVYLHELAPAIAAIARVLAADGIVAFSVERNPGNGVKLLPTLRYAHAEAYLRRTLEAAGLAVAHLAGAAVRSEKGVPVDGLVVVAQPSSAHSRASAMNAPCERSQ
jgi:predicted TPR repeat methyltransferase